MNRCQRLAVGPSSKLVQTDNGWKLAAARAHSIRDTLPMKISGRRAVVEARKIGAKSANQGPVRPSSEIRMKWLG
ncbi:hypothetical protein PPTG_23234 [Phytophthora nicotianae INRA-310]|nr:hypothetical protein PPTG_23234 [Phytophthora nicotianae INRA-310]ETN07157.1 hypothetical protein PPTG_23234 [Phytophthora nicotianae INRA-310]